MSGCRPLSICIVHRYLRFMVLVECYISTNVNIKKDLQKEASAPARLMGIVVSWFTFGAEQRLANNSPTLH